MTSIWFKMSNTKVLHLQLCRFLRKSVSKFMGKTAIWTVFCFPPLSPLNNVEENLLSVIGSQHCIGGEGKF